MYPLASASQLSNTPSRQAGIPADIEDDLRTYGCKLIAQAGHLLSQKQVALSTASILFQRFFYTSPLTQFSIGDVGMGALYLASKLEECQLRIRDLVNVYDLLLQKADWEASSRTGQFSYMPHPYFSSTFYDLRDSIVVAEMQLLKRLGFNTQVVLPYNTLVNYARVLGIESVVERAWGYLNDALQTPVYATNAVPDIVCASILLSTRFMTISLPADWPLLFDTSYQSILSVAGTIMRLYRERTEGERKRLCGMIRKGGVRTWLEREVSVKRLVSQ